MFFLAVNIIKKNCVIGKQGFSLFPFFVLGIVPIFANDNYTLTADYLGVTSGELMKWGGENHVDSKKKIEDPGPENE